MHQSIETLLPPTKPLRHSGDLMQPMPGFNTYYYLFKNFPQFWLAKSTRIIHNNQTLLMTKFGRILCLTRSSIPAKNQSRSQHSTWECNIWLDKDQHLTLPFNFVVLNAIVKTSDFCNFISESSTLNFVHQH